MRILHTSDWHIGRSFHGNSTLPAIAQVLDALVQHVRSQQVDVVAVAGDVFDTTTPSVEAYETLSQALARLRDAGARVVLTSGNHDSATRLGFQSQFAALGGIHVITRADRADRPVTIDDEHGPVHFYGIPYTEPILLRREFPDCAARSHAKALDFLMQRVRRDLSERGGRSVALAHCFAVAFRHDEQDAAESIGRADAGSASAVRRSEEQTVGLERDITSGGLDLVPVQVFDGPDYVALGHLHGRSTLSPRVRYSGAPLHYSFSEGFKPRGAWLVELGAAGLQEVTWLDLPVPRRLSTLEASLDELMQGPEYADHEGDWVSAVLTDEVRPIDAMRKLQQRFPHCARVDHRPARIAPDDARRYGDRVQAKSDPELIDGFLRHVRNGVGATDFELEVLNDVLESLTAREATA
ncbi:exonuclease SbcCD subunit D [Ruicaihuangia caeni]|uniref:exonuclease SbcCD subunit D n=1 Tax=Ruicaihuangia caeni TaxID=3042517 RepID=UPI003390558A